MARWLLHVDLDQFQAAVEFRRHPELRGLPVIVGGNGDPTEPRKVVTCASYPARAFGVRAGMALRSAQRKCPEGVFLPLDMACYEEASDEVMSLLRTFPGRVEVWGWDEAFLAADTDDPEALAREIRGAIEQLELSCSIGIGDNKLTAKLATGFAKSTGKSAAGPATDAGAAAGVFRLTAANWTEVMAHRPTNALWGIGTRIASRLADLGISTVADLMAADRQRLAAEFGPTTGPTSGSSATAKATPTSPPNRESRWAAASPKPFLVTSPIRPRFATRSRGWPPRSPRKWPKRAASAPGSR
ncbi:hypothetical protein GCM10023319_72680 [Nocardia iowensis]